VRNVSDGRTHFVLVWRKSLFMSLVRDKHCFVRSLYPLYLFFFVFCNHSFTFFVNYSPPQVRCTHLPILGTPMRLIWGDEAFTEINFTRLFLFIMYDVYVATVSLIIKLSYSCVLERFTAFS
jgi:hypothetical protein